MPPKLGSGNSAGARQVAQRFLACKSRVRPRYLRNAEDEERERELSYVDRFLKLKPMKFYGTQDSEKAEAWVKNIQKKLKTLHTPPEYQVNLAVHALEGDADAWWDSISERYDVTTMTWEEFVQHFYARYFPEAMR